MLVSGVHQSDLALYIYIYIYIYTYIHTYICIYTYMYVYIYIFLFRFFPIIDYYKILRIVPLCYRVGPFLLSILYIGVCMF